MSKAFWNQLKCSAKELQLKATLTGGQSFRYFHIRFYVKFTKTELNLTLIFHFQMERVK